jgi:hypothetical protein
MLRFRFIDRPITDTVRPPNAAASITCWIRWMCDAKDVTITRPVLWRTISRSAEPTVRSDGVRPGRSAFVESAMRSATPASPSSRRRSRSVVRPSIGVSSSLKSPVWTIAPWSVCRTTATASGTECVTRTNSASNGPTRVRPPSGSISTSSVWTSRPCSSSFDFTSPSVSRVPHTSAWVPISRNRYGRAPM